MKSLRWVLFVAGLCAIAIPARARAQGPSTPATTGPLAAAGVEATRDEPKNTFTTTFDIADVTRAVLWPIAAVVLAVMLRRQLAAVLEALPSRLKSVKVAGVELELDLAPPPSMSEVAGGRVDLRHNGAAQDINDSTQRTFMTQIERPEPLPSCVVDLGNGGEWLSSRLFIVCELLRRMRGLEHVVFVETRDGVARRVLGVARAEDVRWRLAMAFPLLERALVAATKEVWERFQDVVITDAHGRISLASHPDGALCALELLRDFINRVQTPPYAVPGASPDAVVLQSGQTEHAIWLDGNKLAEKLGPSLSPKRIRNGLKKVSEERLVAEIERISADVVPVTDEEEVFLGLLEREQLVKALIALRERPERVAGHHDDGSNSARHSS